MANFLAHPIYIHILMKKFVTFRTHMLDIYKGKKKRKEKKELGLSITSFFSNHHKLVKLGFECYKLLGFHTKSVNKSIMSRRLRKNGQFFL